MKKYFIAVLAISTVVIATNHVDEENVNQSCPQGAQGIACLGSSIAKNVMRQFLGGHHQEDTQRLWNGVNLVHLDFNNSTNFDSSTEQKGRELSNSLLQNLRKLISSYEVRVRISDLVKGVLDEMKNEHLDEDEARKGGSGFGGSGFGGGGGGYKDKKGGGMGAAVMMMAGMMKMMALGALGMLAMKALTVSSLAFMLSVIVGLKKLLSKKDDDDGGHYVQVVGGHGGHGGDHRRRAYDTMSAAAHQLAFKGQRR